MPWFLEARPDDAEDTSEGSRSVVDDINILGEVKGRAGRGRPLRPEGKKRLGLIR